MGIETARRVRDQVREGLAELIRLVNDPSTPTADVREVLSESKALGAQVSVLQADAAVVVSARESHGDCGVGVLARSAGLSRRDAAGQVQTAQSLQSMPAVRDAVETGQICVANAKALARASAKTSAAQVDGDAELLQKAAEMSVEQFVREAGRWAVKRQDDGGEGEYRRQRARRRLSIWDGDDGMVHLRGELDPVSGAKVRKRFLLEAERLRRVDLHSPGGEKRSLNQRMADSLDTLTSHGSIYSKAQSATASRHDRGGTGAATSAGSAVSEPDLGSKEDRGGVSETGDGGGVSSAGGGVLSAGGGVARPAMVVVWARPVAVWARPAMVVVWARPVAVWARPAVVVVWARPVAVWLGPAMVVVWARPVAVWARPAVVVVWARPVAVWARPAMALT